MSGRSLLANRPEAAGGFVCKRFASGAGLIEVPHRFVQSAEHRVEIRAGLLKRCMAEHVLHVVHGPTGFKQAGASFMPAVITRGSRLSAGPLDRRNDVVDISLMYAYHTYMNATWDPSKARANFRKHGVRFSEAEAVLLDPNAISREARRPTMSDGSYRLGSMSWEGRGRGVHLPRGGRAADFSATRNSK